MSKSHSTKETKGNAAVLLKAASDNVSKQLHSTSEGVELGGIVHPFPITQQDQHFLNVSLQMCAWPILKKKTLTTLWYPISFLRNEYPTWIRNTKNSIRGWRRSNWVLPTVLSFGVLSVIKLHILPLTEADPLSGSYWMFLLSLRCLFSTGLWGKTADPVSRRSAFPLCGWGQNCNHVQGNRKSCSNKWRTKKSWS